jgi:hypothetical protein
VRDLAIVINEILWIFSALYKFFNNFIFGEFHSASTLYLMEQR